MSETSIAFVATDTDLAQAVRRRLQDRYGGVAVEEATVIVALGGDGFMLETLHETIGRDLPIFGMNCGTVGFLMNALDEEDLPRRLAEAEEVVLHPLRMTANRADGDLLDALAINEVSLIRATRQAAHIRVSVDGIVRMQELMCDGILVATPAGSTAYNLSAHGTIIPVGAQLLALTPISAFRPRRWRGALLPNTARVVFEVLEADKRPVSATADYTEVRQVLRVEVVEERSVSLRLLFDPEHNLEQRIIQEQFQP